jgi:alpha-L-rhamnosidase
MKGTSRLPLQKDDEEIRFHFGTTLMLTRRDFFINAGIGGATMLGMKAAPFTVSQEAPHAMPEMPTVPVLPALDLGPAKWIWYPSGRCLPNTFVLFRKEIEIKGTPRRATGWIAADSRYLLQVNGRRIQWGPAPSDPRWMEVDPVDLTRQLSSGTNVIASTVLFYGQGDGTWTSGKPGFIFRLEIEHNDGSVELLCSDESWLSHLSRSWQPGHYKRWYLRCLQEEFDARSYPHGWTNQGYRTGAEWLPAMPLPDVSPNDPPICSGYTDYANDLRGNSGVSALRPRTIPLMAESIVPVKHLAEAFRVTWNRPPVEYFECLTPHSFDATDLPTPGQLTPGTYEVMLDARVGTALTFEFAEQLVGWPMFTIEAQEGTVVELMVQEHHRPGNAALLNSHFHSWARFVCRAGTNVFETFDYESLRWLQLHIHGTTGRAIIRDVGVRRRRLPWPHQPEISCSDPAVQTLVKASLNTLVNSAQETAVDGMGRERQQYSGDGGHQMHALYYSVGERRLPARYVATFSQGITHEGYFLDCWPAYDRLARLWERETDASYWGPLVDHGIGFNFDCWHHLLQAGDDASLKEAYPRLLRFFRFLQRLQGEDGLLPAEHLGVPSVYIDHLAYKQQRHKQCALNLYAAVMMKHALAPLCRFYGDSAWAAEVEKQGEALIDAAVRTFWSTREKAFVVNLPWMNEEKEVRFCDRSSALALMYNICPKGDSARSLALLADPPSQLGLSYPANAGWRYWGLATGGRTDVILRDFHTRWMAMDSVKMNNSLQEFWVEQPDGGSVMSHCAVVPLYSLFMDFAGIRPIEPGFRRCTIRPQPADLEELTLTAWTMQGPITFSCRGRQGNRELAIALPARCDGQLLVSAKEHLSLRRVSGPDCWNNEAYALPAGQQTVVQLTYT